MLVLVVGASGAGKDTLLDAARSLLGADQRFRFVRRAITRAADAGGEDHEAITEAEFDRRRLSGAFALSWQAHGLGYGVPADISATIRQGRLAVVNASRAVIGEAAQHFPVAVIQVAASPEVLARRLAGRGREGPGAVAERLRRTVAMPPGIWLETIQNDGEVAPAVAQFVAALSRAAGSAWRS